MKFGRLFGGFGEKEEPVETREQEKTPLEKLLISESDLVMYRAFVERHPDKVKAVETLTDQDLSREEFFQKVQEFNDKFNNLADEETGQLSKVRGVPAEVILKISPERNIRVKYYTNGSVSVTGSQNPHRSY